jgi:hypothetical protein
MPLQATSGAASYDAFGGGVPVVLNYIEDVFSTYLYTGNGSTQTITNGIDLAGKGGLVWIKSRSSVVDHVLQDSARGADNFLYSNSTSAEFNSPGAGSTFNSTGFATGSFSYINTSSATYASWTFRKQPKFFDVVTWTGTGSNTTIAHALGSVPACIMVKRTDTTGDWQVYHRSLANTEYLVLNSTAAKATGATRWNSTTPTSTVFSLGTDATVNASGGTYVAYLFAHDAGGFGLLGTDNVISCGSFTTDGSGNATVSLGYEPQWVMIKSSSNADGWQLVDTMRGMAVSNGLYNGDQVLQAQASSAETSGAFVQPSATGFDITFYGSSRTYIYIAIRRGPMKVPTSGTSVYNAVARTGNNTNTNVTGVGFPVDWCLVKNRTGTSKVSQVYDRLRGAPSSLETWTTGAEASFATSLTSFALMDGVSLGDGNGVNQTGETYINYFYRRAPSFMDVVCYTGTGASSQVLTHNLTVTPQLTIFKKRNASNPWDVVSGNTSYLQLNETLQAFPDTSIAATATTITAPLGAGNGLNGSGATYVAYLFATCAGVSKVGSYTGNGSTQTIDCGFTGGARFVIIKRTDSAGGWYVYDTARGMTTLTDPYLLMNTDDVEVATLGSVTTVSTGFALDSTILAAINVSAATYIFLAIA